MVILREHDFDLLARAIVAPETLMLSRLDGENRVILTTREDRARMAQAFIQACHKGSEPVPIDQHNRILRALTMVEEANA